MPQKIIKDRPGVRRGRRPEGGNDVLYITLGGVEKTVGEWSRELGIPSNTIVARLRNDLSIEDVLRVELVGESYVEPMALPEDITPEMAAGLELLTDDQYLDQYKVPRRSKGPPRGRNKKRLQS